MPQAKINSLPANTVAGAVEYTFLDGKIKTAILVNASSVKMLLCYHRYQDLQIYELDTTNYKETKIDEYLDINELRRVLKDATSGGSYTAGNGISISGTTIAVADDIETDNFFANEEIEFSDSSGDFGTNAKARIQATALPDGTGHLGQVLKHITSGNVWGDYTPVDVELKDASGTLISGNLKFVKCSASEYASLTPDANTFYIIVG